MGLSKKTLKNGGLEKITFFKTVNSQYFFSKLNWIGPWVSRINWCEEHQCDSNKMVVGLSNIRPKTGKKHKKCICLFYALCRTVWRPYRLSQIDAFCISLSYWPKGRNFDDYPGFQPMRSWANTYAQDCTSFWYWRSKISQLWIYILIVSYWMIICYCT